MEIGEIPRIRESKSADTWSTNGEGIIVPLESLYKG